MKKVWAINRRAPSFRSDCVRRNSNESLFGREIFPFIHQRHPVAARAVEQHDNRNRMLRSGGVRNENVIGSLFSFEFERFFANFLSSDAREKTGYQDLPTD